MIVREPKFANKFYPEKPKALISMLQDLYNRVEFSHKKIRAKGILLPHAAYHYSGQVAMSVLKCIEIPENIIIVAPNHNGLGEDVNIITEGRFITPIGDVSINSDIAKDITKNIPEVQEDIKSHLIEHSIEVQLPLLKYLRNDIRIVPILIKKLSSEKLTKLISDFINFLNNNIITDILLISSSDLSHYEVYEETIRKDKLLLKHIEQMDIYGLKKVIDEEKISMCGYECTALNIELCRALGATQGIIKRYDTSSSNDANYENVVGYAGVCFV